MKCDCCGRGISDGAFVMGNGLCIRCNNDWMESDERETAEQVEAAMLDGFKRRLSARKARVAELLAEAVAS